VRGAGPAGWWRHLVLAGLIAGLLASATLDPPADTALLLTGCAATALLLARRASPPRPAVVAALLLAVAALAGVLVGEGRRAALERGALAGPAGASVRAEGFVVAVPRRSRGEVRIPLTTGRGRVMVVGREPVAVLGIGDRIRASGRLAEPEPWRAGELRRLGIRLELRARRVRPLPGRRGGLAGVLDRIRTRAEGALNLGVDEDRAALARGFVLGQDDLIEPAVREDFKRSGLAHLLAVSGQNVMLLAILAGALLAVAGTGLRVRLLLILAVIAVYVPVAGAGPSIQRAGIMGAAGIVAALASRPRDRSYPLLLAAAGTLALNPHAAGDVGWQLSFAAVGGIALATAPIRDHLRRRLPRWLPDRVAAPLAEGAALTIAATVATAPLMSHHFGAFSAASLPANLLALPAVAPVMWLGMLAAMAAQLPFVPDAVLAAIGSVAGVGVGFIAAVAAALGRPGWALAPIGIPGPAAVAGTYAAILCLAAVAFGAARRRRGLTAGVRLRGRAIILALAVVVLVPAPAGILPAGGAEGPVPPGVLRVSALDVGQGDAILLETARGDPILVDGGPPGAGLAERLRERGVSRLRAALLSHDDLDHAGGLLEVVGRVPVGIVGFARPAPRLAAAARAAGARVVRLYEGGSIRAGRLRLDALWPPRPAAGLPTTRAATDHNGESLVLAARIGRFTALLTGDAEQEATRLDPGPVDLLKVAHHGSEDAGLGALLDRSAPRAALIPVGAGNPYGHPAPPTTAALAERGVCVLRTDRDGTVSVDLGAGGLAIPPGPDLGGRLGCGTAR
jgi:competence protein ComEC